MSSVGSEVSQGGRRLLVSTEFSLPWPVIKATTGAQEDLIDPIKLEVHPLVSLQVRLHSRAKGRSHFISVEVTDIESQVSSLLIKGGLVVIPRADGDASFNNVRSSWPAAEAPLWCSLLEAGQLGAVPLLKTRALTVIVKVSSSPPAPSALGRALDAVRTSSELTDFIVIAEGQKFHVHGVVMAALSPYFRNMLTSDFREKQERHVTLEGVAKRILGKFIEFLYTETIANWDGCEFELLELADRFIVDELKRECERRLMQVDKTNLVAVLRYCIKMPIVTKAVRVRAGQVLAENWTEVSKSKDWKAFEKDQPAFADLMSGAAMMTYTCATPLILDY